MVQFLSIIFFLGFLQFLLGFSKVPVFFCHPVPYRIIEKRTDSFSLLGLFKFSGKHTDGWTLYFTHQEMLNILFYCLYEGPSTFGMQFYDVIPELYVTSGQAVCKLLGKPVGCMPVMF